MCRPPPCYNQGPWAGGWGWELTPTTLPPPSLHLGTARSPRISPLTMRLHHIRRWCASREKPEDGAAGLTAGAQLESPVLGSNCAPCSTTEAGLELPESAFSICKAQSAVCLRARQGDHPEGRAGWSWADSDAHPQHRTPPPHPYASGLLQGLTSGDESTLCLGPLISVSELKRNKSKTLLGLFFFFFLATI